MFNTIRMLQNTTILELTMDLKPKLDPNVILHPDDIEAVALHFPDCGLFGDDCNTESPYNNGGKSKDSTSCNMNDDLLLIDCRAIHGFVLAFINTVGIKKLYPHKI